MTNSTWRTALPRRGLSNPKDAGAFFDLARQLARARGAEQAAYLCGCIGARAFVYGDRVVQVAAAVDGPALEIRLKYPDGKCVNPVIMVTDGGEAIRVHGEHAYVVPHIEAVVANPHLLRVGRCCLVARPRACVCSFSWECEAHGATCVGTHD